MTRRRKWIALVVGCLFAFWVFALVTASVLDWQFGTIDWQVR